jgi:hypothetical protein
MFHPVRNARGQILENLIKLLQVSVKNDKESAKIRHAHDQLVSIKDQNRFKEVELL